jgi:TRAP-type C4-dicarboxylate transport system substrate-binding protein
MKTKISNIIKENRFMDSKSYNSLSPKMKEVIKEIYRLIENEQKDILTRFDGAIEKVTASYNIKKEDIHKYFDKEVNEQLGV